MVDKINTVSSKTAPNPNEVDYWVDLNENAYGKVVKFFNGTRWERTSPVDEAPNDGKSYVRKNGEWIEAPIEGVFEDVFSYGVRIVLDGVSDPHLIRIGNPALHKTLPIQSSYKGCVSKGKTILYYLDENDWNKKQDGTPSVLNGDDGDVRVEIPTFYVKMRASSTYVDVYESTIKYDDTWFAVPHMLVDAYRCTVANGKTRSVVNTTPDFRGGNNSSQYDQYLNTDAFRTNLGKPRTNISRADMRKYAFAAGSELMCYEWYKWVFYWNPIIEYANFDLLEAFNDALTTEGYKQGGLGAGVTGFDWGIWTKYNGNNPITPCGYCNELGNRTGIKALIIPDSDGVTTKTFNVARWRGFDNIFGDIYTNLEGIVIKRDEANQPSKVFATYNPNNFDDSTSNKPLIGIETEKEGYITSFYFGENAEIIPSDCSGGSDKTFMCDYHYCNPTYTGDRTLRVGGTARDSGTAGVGCFRSDSSVGYAASYVGFRTVTILD